MGPCIALLSVLRSEHGSKPEAKRLRKPGQPKLTCRAGSEGSGQPQACERRRKHPDDCEAGGAAEAHYGKEGTELRRNCSMSHASYLRWVSQACALRSVNAPALLRVRVC